MTFDEILTQVIALLQREGRVSYRALKVRFNLDDDHLEAVKDELIEAKQLAVDERDKVLVWTGSPTKEGTENRRIGGAETSGLESSVQKSSEFRVPSPQFRVPPNPQSATRLLT